MKKVILGLVFTSVLLGPVQQIKRPHLLKLTALQNLV